MASADEVQLTWRGWVGNAELNWLHAEAFGHALETHDWSARLDRFSAGWVVARDERGLVGFVNVAGDGGVHAFLLDTCVARRARGRGIGVRLVRTAVEGARAAGCEWLHVDYTEDLAPFYRDACGFRPTAAGLLAL
jgi:GNAT superfamily N-acetyltransferase